MSYLDDETTDAPRPPSRPPSRPSRRPPPLPSRPVSPGPTEARPGLSRDATRSLISAGAAVIAATVLLAAVVLLVAWPRIFRWRTATKPDTQLASTPEAAPAEPTPSPALPPTPPSAAPDLRAPSPAAKVPDTPAPPVPASPPPPSPKTPPHAREKPATKTATPPDAPGKPKEEPAKPVMKFAVRPAPPSNPQESAKKPGRPAAEDRGALADVRRKSNRLPLPPYDGNSAKPHELAKLAGFPIQCELSLDGQGFALDHALEYVLKAGEGQDHDKTWTVEAAGQNGLAHARLGAFILDSNSLQFRWDANVPKEAYPKRLAYCLLELKSRGETEICSLADPLPCPAATINLFAEDPTFVIPLPKGASVVKSEMLRLDLRFDGYPAQHSFVRSLSPGPESVATLYLSAPEGENARPLDVHVTFLHSTKDGPYLAFRAEANRTAFLDGGGQPLTPLTFPRPNYEDRVKQLKAKIEKQTADEELLLSKIQDDERAIRESRVDQEDRKKRTRDRVEIRKGQAQQVRNDIGRAEKEVQWYEDLMRFAEELPDKGRIEFRLYLDVAGTPIELTESPGFQNPSQ